MTELHNSDESLTGYQEATAGGDEQTAPTADNTQGSSGARANEAVLATPSTSGRYTTSPTLRTQQHTVYSTRSASTHAFPASSLLFAALPCDHACLALPNHSTPTPCNQPACVCSEGLQCPD